MLRVVIDTSTWVSYALTKSTLLSRLVDSWRSGQFVLITSPATLTELAQVLNRPVIKRRAIVALDEMVAGLDRFAETAPGILGLSGASRDPKDDKFIACALEGQAHYLVSSDTDLLDMRWYQETAIVNPGQFLLALEIHSLSPSEISKRHAPMVLERILAHVPLQPVAAQRARDALALQVGLGADGA